MGARAHVRQNIDTNKKYIWTLREQNDNLEPCHGIAEFGSKADGSSSP
jgi:hypothetical protein